MSVSNDLKKIVFTDKLRDHDNFQLLATMHSVVEKKEFPNFALDFSRCTKAFSSQMLLICAQCQYYWKQGIDITLELPTDLRLKRLFLNANWAHLIDSKQYEPSRFRGYTHAPTIKFEDGEEQHEAVSKLLDTLMTALKHFKRDDIRYIEWAINEITDNVINHSESQIGGLIQITNFRQRKQIEISVCDAGRGIPASLRTSDLSINSDQEALRIAIREGVTRDKSFGQGNGLYGTWQIAQKSGGDFRIVSGDAYLKSSKRNDLHIGKLDTPINGTLVTVKIGYSEAIDISDVLVFAGRPHVPIDYIESHFNEDEHGNVDFVLKSESNGFGSRAAGGPVRRKLYNIASMLEDGQIIINCDDVPLVSSSYADEVFGKLFVDIGPVDFARVFQFRNIDPLVKDLLDRAITQRINQ